ncbi:MAG: HTTM domain-containing protein [Saprospirales bacterium]|nr:HTTM domain-containing protein [Saprospirales bacterium]
MERLFQRVDIASLVFFRIAFGILAFAEVMVLLNYYHLTLRDFEPDEFQFKYFGFEWVQPFPEPFMSAFFGLLLLACIGIILGKWYRISALLFSLGFTYIFLLEKAHYLNHWYLFIWLSFLMVLLPANREWSLDVARNTALRRKTIPFWSLAILPFLMGVVYFYGGIAKINVDWLQGEPLKTWLRHKDDMPVIGWLLAKEGTAYLMSYGGMLLDLSIAFLLLFRKTRLPALAAALFFHLTNTIIFNIGVFPWLSLVLTLLFFPPDLPRRWIALLRSRSKWVDRRASRWEQRMADTPDASSWHDRAGYKPFIKTGLVLLVAFHLLYPLRHHLLEGPVAWTEEGHRFSWRMMLRWKNGYGHFTMVDPATGTRQSIQPSEYLSAKQTQKLFSHPDMILQFAHHLRDTWCDNGIEDVEVYATIKAQLNGCPYQPYIDPEVDLAAEEWDYFKKTAWIIPLNKPELEKEEEEESNPESE